MYHLSKILATFGVAALVTGGAAAAVDQHANNDAGFMTITAEETISWVALTGDTDTDSANTDVVGIPTPVEANAQSDDDQSHAHATGSTTMAEGQYEAYANMLKSTLHAYGAEEAVNALEQLITQEPDTLALCHNLAHELGHEQYERNGKNLQRALAYQSDICGSGFIHGMIETSFADMKDVRAEMQSVCNGIDAGKCYHGVGHGLMFYTNNDLPFALELCDTYSSAEARARCYEGVFMENFHADAAMHPSAYRNPGQPLFPCSNQESVYKNACYFYAPRAFLELHPGAYTDMFDHCLGAEEGYITTCTRGVGSALAKHHIGDTELYQHVCTAAGLVQMHACIDGVVSYTMVHYDDATHAEALCDELSVDMVAACRKSVQSRAYLFQE